MHRHTHSHTHKCAHTHIHIQITTTVAAIPTTWLYRSIPCAWITKENWAALWQHLGTRLAFKFSSRVRDQSCQSEWTPFNSLRAQPEQRGGERTRLYLVLGLQCPWFSDLWMPGLTPASSYPPLNSSSTCGSQTLVKSTTDCCFSPFFQMDGGGTSSLP